MPRIRTYQCPSCDGKFQFTHHPTDEPPPRFCPLCGHDTEKDDALTETLSVPALQSRATRGIDDIFKADEEGAQFRADMAQVHHGLSAEDAASIRMSNMQTNNRAGEDSIIPVSNSVTQLMDQAPAGSVGFGGGAAAGLGYSQSVSTGPFPNAGARTMQKVRNQHATSLIGSGHRGPVSSELPALETQQPGYRRRV